MLPVPCHLRLIYSQSWKVASAASKKPGGDSSPTAGLAYALYGSNLGCESVQRITLGIGVLPPKTSAISARHLPPDSFFHHPGWRTPTMTVGVSVVCEPQHLANPDTLGFVRMKPGLTPAYRVPVTVGARERVVFRVAGPRRPVHGTVPRAKHPALGAGSPQIPTMPSIRVAHAPPTQTRPYPPRGHDQPAHNLAISRCESRRLDAIKLVVWTIYN